MHASACSSQVHKWTTRSSGRQILDRGSTFSPVQIFRDRISCQPLPPNQYRQTVHFSSNYLLPTSSIPSPPSPVLSCMDKLVSLTNRPDSLTGTMGFTIFWPKNTFPFILLAPIDLVMEALSKELSNGMHLTKFSMVKC